MAASRIRLISKKLIKPSSPTPSSLRSYKLSLMDQIMIDSYMSIASFYPNTQQTIQISQLLETSLSRLLTSYYPVAGTLNDNISVDCNDVGVTFLEAQIKSSMSEILQQADSRVLDIVVPSHILMSPTRKDELVIAQLNHFECGGKALSLCMSHKLGDASTMANFMSDWAAIARRSSEEPSPEFIGVSVYPPKDTHIAPNNEVSREPYVGRRFSFDGKKIAQLKDLVAAESGVRNPTRVEVINALLWKSAIFASNSQSFSPSMLVQFVNMRRLAVPPLAHNSFGNILSLFNTPTVEEEDMKLSKMVSNIRRCKLEFYEKCKLMTLNQLLLNESQVFDEQRKFLSQGMNVYNSTSLCGFELKNLDMGWGRPMKVTLPALPETNFFMLMDDVNGDGVEATVNLDEKTMSIFQNDKELLEFASSNYIYV